MPATSNGTDVVIALAGSLVFISLAAERLVEVVKGWVPSLNLALADPVLEGRRRTKLHVLAIAFGMLTVAIAYDPLAQMSGMEWMASAGPIRQGMLVLALGLLSAGGSSFWNSILTYFLSVKDLKRHEADHQKAELADKDAALPQAAPRARLPRPPLVARAG